MPITPSWTSGWPATTACRIFTAATSGGSRSIQPARDAACWGRAAPVPPPGVETNLEKDPAEVKTTSLRQRLEAHRSNPTCASCHKIMDPIGFALENFDLVGTWREREGRI